MIACPECGGIRLRIHGAQQTIEWVKRYGWFGHLVARGTTTAIDVSCAECFTPFIAFADGIVKRLPKPGPVTPPPKDSATQGKGRTRTLDSIEPDANARKARPAPDPRVRR